MLGKGIDEYLGSFIDKKAALKKKLALLRLGPHRAFEWNLGHFFLFYKYILRDLPYSEDDILTEFDSYFPDQQPPRPDKEYRTLEGGVHKDGSRGVLRPDEEHGMYVVTPSNQRMPKPEPLQRAVDLEEVDPNRHVAVSTPVAAIMPLHAPNPVPDSNATTVTVPDPTSGLSLPTQTNTSAVPEHQQQVVQTNATGALVNQGASLPDEEMQDASPQDIELGRAGDLSAQLGSDAPRFVDMLSELRATPNHSGEWQARYNEYIGYIKKYIEDLRPAVESGINRQSVRETEWLQKLLAQYEALDKGKGPATTQAMTAHNSARQAALNKAAEDFKAHYDASVRQEQARLEAARAHALANFQASAPVAPVAVAAMPVSALPEAPATSMSGPVPLHYVPPAAAPGPAGWVYTPPTNVARPPAPEPEPVAMESGPVEPQPKKKKPARRLLKRPETMEDQREINKEVKDAKSNKRRNLVVARKRYEQQKAAAKLAAQQISPEDDAEMAEAERHLRVEDAKEVAEQVNMKAVREEVDREMAKAEQELRIADAKEVAARRTAIAADQGNRDALNKETAEAERTLRLADAKEFAARKTAEHGAKAKAAILDTSAFTADQVAEHDQNIQEMLRERVAKVLKRFDVHVDLSAKGGWDVRPEDILVPGTGGKVKGRIRKGHWDQKERGQPFFKSPKQAKKLKGGWDVQEGDILVPGIAPASGYVRRGQWDQKIRGLAHTKPGKAKPTDGELNLAVQLLALIPEEKATKENLDWLENFMRKYGRGKK